MDSMWNTPRHYHGTRRVPVFMFFPRGISMENVVFHGNSVEYSTWNPTQSPSKTSCLVYTRDVYSAASSNPLTINRNSPVYGLARRYIRARLLLNSRSHTLQMR